MLDLYADVSSAEGWGLTSLEAAACGVPVISVDDEMARSEVHSRYCHMLKPVYWDTWHTGTKLAMLDPGQVADKIVELKEDEDLRNQYADVQVNIMKDLPWKKTANLFIDLIRKAYRQKAYQ